MTLPHKHTLLLPTQASRLTFLNPPHCRGSGIQQDLSSFAHAHFFWSGRSARPVVLVVGPTSSMSVSMSSTISTRTIHACPPRPLCFIVSSPCRCLWGGSATPPGAACGARFTLISFASGTHSLNSSSSLTWLSRRRPKSSTILFWIDFVPLNLSCSWLLGLGGSSRGGVRIGSVL